MSTHSIPRRHPVKTSLAVAVAALTTLGIGIVSAPRAGAAVPFPVASLDGSGHNLAHPSWGQIGQPYSRVAATAYADGVAAPVAGPNTRYVSNRVFNDIHQNLFSERRVTQWGFAWGQFLDHTFGLREGAEPDQPQGEVANIPFDASDPIEEFENDLGVIPFTRSAAAPGTGTSVGNPRQQNNTVSSYIDAWTVYGGTAQRLEWLRAGPVDGNLGNNSALLLLPDSYLPRRDSRGDPASAPLMELNGRLSADPANAAVAGDVRANENLALTATHTLFAREHNRIVSLLPSGLSEQDKFDIARRVVMAEQQYITYQEWLPAMGVALPQYTGYNPSVNTTLSNEFATVGYRAHSQIHGEFEIETDADRYTPAELAALQAQGLEVQVNGDEVDIAIPLNVAFFNPDLLTALGLGPMLAGLGGESQYRNDEQIDNQLRSVLFQIPVSGNPECLDGEELPECFNGVVDLAAIDIERGRDHGIPTYNQLRQAYGLAPKTSFTAITGESTDQFPSGTGIDDPASLEFVALSDIDGTPVDLNDEDAVEGTATTGVRGSTVAARLKAIYGSVNSIDAFVGMSAEAHVPGTEFGELQLAIWTREFQRLRDGDRFFFGNDQGLSFIRNTYGIDYRRTLAEVIADNTDVDPADLRSNVFLVSDDDLPATTCHVDYTITTSWPGGFQVNSRISNTGSTPVNGWTLRYQLYNGQSIQDRWNGTYTQSGPGGRDVTVTNAPWNGTIPAGGSMDGIGFNASWDNLTNARPPNVSLNGHRCTVGG